jgi:hypothetical protein
MICAFCCSYKQEYLNLTFSGFFDKGTTTPDFYVFFFCSVDILKRKQMFHKGQKYVLAVYHFYYPNCS